MFIGKVKGNVVTTQKVETLTGKKLLIVEPMRVMEDTGTMTPSGKCLVAVDSVGAGESDLVLCTQGSSARMTCTTSDAPVDCVITGIIDSVTAQNKTVYKKD
jgi:ethanolamine utilization protein EutN